MSGHAAVMSCPRFGCCSLDVPPHAANVGKPSAVANFLEIGVVVVPVADVKATQFVGRHALLVAGTQLSDQVVGSETGEP